MSAARTRRRHPILWTLDGYIGRRAATIFIADLLLFSLVYVLVDSLNQVESFLDSAPDFPALVKVAASYYYYQLPGLFCQILGPVTTMASAMFAVTLTARGNEFVPILATGTCLQRALSPLVVLALVAAAGTLWIQERWIPAHRVEIRDSLTYGRGHGEIHNAFYSDPASGTRAAMRVYHPSSQQGEGVLIILDEGDGERLITAAAARWEQETPGRSGRWVLENGQIQEFDSEGLLKPVPAPPPPEGAAAHDPPAAGPPLPANAAPPAPSSAPAEEAGKRKPKPPPATVLARPFERWVFDSSNMIPQDLEGADSQDSYLSLDELWRKSEVAPDGHRWRVRYYARLSSQCHHLVLLLLGVPTLFLRGTRNVFLSALLAVAIAAAYFIAQAVAVYAGNRQWISPALAAWLAPIFFGSLGVTLWRGMRT